MKNAAIAIVLPPQGDDQVLWIKRSDLAIWVLPGGGIEMNESPEEAMQREVKEECGLEVEVLRKAAQYSPINFWTRETHVYVCRAKEMPSSTTEEASQISFFPISSTPYPHFPMHVDWLSEAFLHPTEVIKRPQSELTWQRIWVFFLRHPLIMLRYLFLRFLLLFGSCFFFLLGGFLMLLSQFL